MDKYLIENGTDFAGFFLKIPTMEQNKVEEAFMRDILKNEILLQRFRRIEQSLYFQQFYRMLEEQGWEADYYNFRKKYLIQTAKKWCEDNGIWYTTKEEPVRKLSIQEYSDAQKELQKRSTGCDRLRFRL